jgi:hypothetical protein
MEMCDEEAAVLVRPKRVKANPGCKKNDMDVAGSEDGANIELSAPEPSAMDAYSTHHSNFSLPPKTHPEGKRTLSLRLALTCTTIHNGAVLLSFEENTLTLHECYAV